MVFLRHARRRGAVTTRLDPKGKVGVTWQNRFVLANAWRSRTGSTSSAGVGGADHHPAYDQKRTGTRSRT
jgi:hypothetical protein